MTLNAVIWLESLTFKYHSIFFPALPESFHPLSPSHLLPSSTHLHYTPGHLFLYTLDVHLLFSPCFTILSSSFVPLAPSFISLCCSLFPSIDLPRGVAKRQQPSVCREGKMEGRFSLLGKRDEGCVCVGGCFNA